MARGGDPVSTDEKVRRSVARVVGGLMLLVLFLVALAGWAWLGTYQLEPGQAAIILTLGRRAATVTEPGFKIHWPPPFQTREIVNAAEIEEETFGFLGGAGAHEGAQAALEASMQTSDNNIVQLSFVVQYNIKDAFATRYRVAEPIAILRDSAQAAVREVVGRMTIDGVLSEQRGIVQVEAEQKLQEILDEYETGLDIQGVQLQDVQPPTQVRGAFDDVIGAAQDASRVVNEAEGYRNELLPRARAEAAELVEAARGYRDSKIAEASGSGARFTAIAAEYRKAPDVTIRRLYLETMEQILPSVEKVIIEPGTTNVLPYLPLRRGDAGVAP